MGAIRPSSFCSRCGKKHAVEILQYLPEVDSYKRAFAMSLSKGLPRPEMLDEDALVHKYGYGSNDLFCPNCLDELTMDDSDSE